jgi:hypothetical protein
MFRSCGCYICVVCVIETVVHRPSIYTRTHRKKKKKREKKKEKGVKNLKKMPRWTPQTREKNLVTQTDAEEKKENKKKKRIARHRAKTKISYSLS